VLRQEQRRRIRDAAQAAVGHREHAELVDRAEAVLERAHQPEGRVRVALEVEHRVDHVLEHARARERALLGHVADHAPRDAGLLGEARELRRALAHLRDRARRRLQLLGVQRLDRVDDRDRGLAASMRGDTRSSWISASSGTSAAVDAEAPRAQRDLRGRLLAAHVEHRQRATGARAPAAAASTCRCRDRRRSAPPSPRPARRPARGRTPRAGGEARHSATRHDLVEPLHAAGRRAARSGCRRRGARPRSADRLLQRVPGLAARGHCPATSRRRRTRCRRTACFALAISRSTHHRHARRDRAQQLVADRARGRRDLVDRDPRPTARPACRRRPRAPVEVDASMSIDTRPTVRVRTPATAPACRWARGADSRRRSRRRRRRCASARGGLEGRSRSRPLAGRSDCTRDQLASERHRRPQAERGGAAVGEGRRSRTA
jgi:hypothetical protein